MDRSDGSIRIRRGGRLNESAKNCHQPEEEEVLGSSAAATRQRRKYGGSYFGCCYKRHCTTPIRWIVTLILLGIVVFSLQWRLPQRPTFTTMIADEDNSDSFLFFNQRQQRRFPLAGSPAFDQLCPWIREQPHNQNSNCTLLFRPSSTEREGIAKWVGYTVQSYMQARYLGCHFLADYGQSVQLDQVLDAAPRIRTDRDWKVAPGFVCSPQTNCYLGPISPKQVNYVAAPDYRHVYYTNTPVYNVYKSQLEPLQQHFPNLDLTSGFACSFNSVFHSLAPAANQFQSNLHNQLLPTLRDPRNLVLAIYVRTGWTDEMARAEKANKTAKDTIMVPSVTKAPVQCAQQLEQQMLSSLDANPKGRIQSVVWMLVTDSMRVKEYVANTYQQQQIVIQQNNNTTKMIPRLVLTTQATGRHSRPAGNPSTVEFAESIIDWYLIGESDVVITNNDGYTFPTTGALRTNRTIYLGARKRQQGSSSSVSTCSEMTWHPYD